MTTLKLKAKEDNIKIQEEVDFNVFRIELMPYIAHNYSENPGNGECPFDLNIEACENLFKHGNLKVITAREDGKFVGYILWMVISPLDMQTTLSGTCYAVYVSPEYRKTGVGRKLFEVSIRRLKSLGVKRLFSSVRDSMDFSSLIESMGGRKFETVYIIE